MKLAFCGVAGIGKDYLADYLVKKHGYAKVAFADYLKKITHELFPFVPLSPSPKEKETKLENGMTPREIWIEVADVLRSIDDDIFINKTQEKLKMLKCKNIIITDIRDIKELEKVKEWGYTTIALTGVPIHIRNEYDTQIESLQSKCEYEFYNEFNGLSRFEEFYASLVNKAE